MIGYVRRAKITPSIVPEGFEDIQDDRVDAADFVDDAGRGAAEKIVREGAV